MPKNNRATTDSRPRWMLRWARARAKSPPSTWNGACSWIVAGWWGKGEAFWVGKGTKNDRMCYWCWENPKLECLNAFSLILLCHQKFSFLRPKASIVWTLVCVPTRKNNKLLISRNSSREISPMTYFQRFSD